MANEYLQRTPTSTGNRKVWTCSLWAKKNIIGTTHIVLSGAVGDGSVERSSISFNSDNAFEVVTVQSSSVTARFKTDKLLRDVGNWMHIVVSCNTTASNARDRLKLFINGVQYTQGFNTVTDPSQNADLNFNDSSQTHRIGKNHATTYANSQYTDYFWVDGQSLTPDVFGFYKDGNGYISAGSTQATDFRPGQWVPKTPRVIKAQIERNGGFGVNGFYLPMNDSSNFGADFHTTPNSIITLKGEDLPQPRNGAPTTTDAYVSQLREDLYADNLVLAVPGISGGTSSGYGDYSADIKGSGSNKTLTANGNAGVAVTASYYGSALSFDGSGDYLSQTYDADFNFGTDDFTLEMWVYPNTVNSIDGLFAVSGGGGGGVPKMAFHLNSGTPSVHYNGLTGASDIYTTSGTSIPAGQWSHLAYTRKGTTWTWYINGVATGTGSNSTVITFTSQPYYIGYGGEGYFDSFDGKIQDLRIYKGVAKYKGGFDVPKPYTPVGIATWRAVPDTTANNFATLNAVIPATNFTLSDGNLSQSGNQTSGYFTPATISVSSGKWYWEARPSSVSNIYFGIASNPFGNGQNNTHIILRMTGDLFKKIDGSSSNLVWTSFNSGDILAVALDIDNGTATWYKNGSSIGTISSDIIGREWRPIQYVNGIMSTNFGQNPTFSGNTTAGTFTDSNGKGLFKYQPPSGFLALCEDNLPTPAIADPGKHFKTVLWTGDGNSGRSIVGVGFTPDLVWVKSRNVAQDHVLHDSVRSAGYYILSNSTQQEVFNSAQITSFNSDGFTVGTSIATNENSKTFVAWCWRAGAGTTSTNTDGSITSVVSVNQDAGFSIVSYTGTGSAGTVGHGLGKAPNFILVKSRNGARDWIVYHSQRGATEYGLLNSTGAFTAGSTFWNNTSPTSSVFSVGTALAVNASAENLIAYCWAEIEGYSKAFSYVGNGSADGPMIFLGLKPALIIIKRTNDAGNWQIYDSSRMSTNPNNGVLFPNSVNIEGVGSAYDIDFLSNGFKLRSTDTDRNASGSTYVGFAWAESPFSTSNSK